MFSSARAQLPSTLQPALRTRQISIVQILWSREFLKALCIVLFYNF